MAKRRRRKGRRGTGSIITTRLKGFMGLGAVNNPKSPLGAILPPAVGGGVAGITMLSIRQFVNPAAGETQLMAYKHAPGIGIAAGLVGAGGMYYLSGYPAALGTAAAAVVVGGLAYAAEYLAAQQLAAAAAAAPGGTAGLYGMGAVVPEYQAMRGLGATVLEPLASRGYGSGLEGLNSYGAEINLSGVGAIQPSAFGTPTFRI